MSANFNSMLISSEEYESFHQSEVYIDDYPNQQFMSKDKETIEAKLCVFKPEDDIQTIFVAVYPPTNSTPDNQNNNATCKFIKRYIDKFIFVDIYPWAPITASGKIDYELLTKKIKKSKKRKMLSKAFWLYLKSIISYAFGNGVTPMIVLCGPFIKTIFKDFKGEVEFVYTYTCDHETSKYRIIGTDIEFNVKSTDHPSAHLLSNTNKQFPETDLPMIKAFNERTNDIDDISIKLEESKQISIANKRIFMKSLKSLKCKELKDEWSHWNNVNYTDDVMVRIANIRKTVGNTVFKSMMNMCFINKIGFDEFCKVWHDRLGDKFMTFMSGSVAAAYNEVGFQEFCELWHTRLGDKFATFMCDGVAAAYNEVEFQKFCELWHTKLGDKFVTFMSNSVAAAYDKVDFQKFCELWHTKLGDKFVTFMCDSVAAAYDKIDFQKFCELWHTKLGDKFVTFMSGSVAAAYDNTNFINRINDLYNTLSIEHFLRLEGSFIAHLKSEDDSFVVSFKTLYKKQNVKERANMMKVITLVCAKKNVKNARFWKILEDCSKLGLTQTKMMTKIRDELKVKHDDDIP